MVRDSAGEGERASAAWVAERMRGTGAQDVAVESFRYTPTYSWAQGVHYAAGIAAASLGGWQGAVLALKALVSLELDFSGRSQWLRRFLPQGEGANVAARVPAAGERERTLVLVAHHDAAHTGLVWDPRVLALSARKAAETNHVDAFTAGAEAAFALIAVGSLTRAKTPRLLGAAVLLAALGLVADVGRSETVPGASDNATGVAAVLALTERFARDPLPGTEVIALCPGCEEPGMGGMAAWMRAHGRELDPATTLVLGLDTLGAGEPALTAGEGPALTVRYREADLTLAEKAAARAGLAKPPRARLGGYTDPVLARHAGLPAISLVSLQDGVFTNYHLPTDTPDRVDWDSVERCTRLAAAIADEFAASG